MPYLLLFFFLPKKKKKISPDEVSGFWAASHLPYNRNGLKFFTNAGGLGKPDIKDILERAADIYKKFMVEGLTNSEKQTSTSIKRVDYMSVYTSDLVKAVRRAAGDIGTNSFLKCSIGVEVCTLYVD